MDAKRLGLTLSDVQERVFGLLLPPASEQEFCDPSPDQRARLEALRLTRAAIDLVAGLAETQSWDDFQTYVISHGEPLRRVIAHWRTLVGYVDVASAFGDWEPVSCPACGCSLLK